MKGDSSDSTRAVGTQWAPADEVSDPSGDAGKDTDRSRCTCGAGPHPDLPHRCEAGHVVAGNQLATVVGHRSATFWREHDQARRELAEAIIRDGGHDPEEAPEALKRAADSLAQAAIIQASAYARMAEAGGPLTSSGRARRSFDVWTRATDRLERHVRLVGLDRAPKPVPSLEDYLRQRQQEAEAGEATS